MPSRRRWTVPIACAVALATVGGARAAVATGNGATADAAASASPTAAGSSAPTASGTATSTPPTTSTSAAPTASVTASTTTSRPTGTATHGPAADEEGTTAAATGSAADASGPSADAGTDGSDEADDQVDADQQLASTAVDAAADDGVQRVTGADRVATSVAVARDRFPGGEDAAVLASATDFADALAGSALSASVDGPLLLSARDGLDPRVADELRAHLRPGSTVWVLGGPRALGPAVDQQLAALGAQVRRVAGPDRYATAAAITDQLRERGAASCDVVLATGRSFPDGASASGIVAADRPLMYTDGPAMPAATSEALRACPDGKVTTVGGPATSAAASPGALPSTLLLNTVVGDDRYDTSARVMEVATTSTALADRLDVAGDPASGSAAGPSSSPSATADQDVSAQAASAVATRASSGAGAVVLASGQDFPDAMIGGTYQRPVLLTEPHALPGSVARALHTAHDELHGVVVVGGENAVSDATAQAAAQIAAGADPSAVLAAMPAAPTSSASPSAGPSAGASPGATATPGPGAGSGAGAAASGRWLSGASGTGVGDGSFGAWRGTPVQIAGTWADNNTAMVQVSQLAPGAEYGSWDGPIDIAIGAIGDGESWSAAAGGAYDARWRASLTKIKELRGAKGGQVYIRFAHEMNGDWYPWKVTSGNKDAFVAAWKRFRAIQQQVYPSSKLVFCVNRESVGSGFDWRQSFPGAQYVDVVGVDYYNQWPFVDSAGAWDASMGAKDGYGAPKGLQAHLDFARSVGLPLAVGEWSSTADQGDSGLWVTKMHDFFAAHGGAGAGQLLYEIQFNAPMGDGKFMFFGGSRLPNSAKAYQQAF